LLAIFSADLDGSLRTSNAAFLSMLGYSPADPSACPQSLGELTPAEFRDLDEIAFDELATTGSCRPYSKAMFRRDGSRVWVTVGGAIVNRNEAAFFAIDAKARTEADERVAESRRLLQSIIDSIPAFVAYIDASGRYRIGNRYHAGHMAPAGAAVGRPVTEVFARGPYVRLAGHLRRALGGETARTMLVVNDDAGTQRNYQVQLQPRHDGPGGSVAGVVLHAYEVTEQLQRQRALLDSEVRFRRLAEASAAIVCHLDISGAVIHLSGWRRFTGGSGVHSFRQLLASVHPEDLPLVRRFLARSRRRRITIEVEFRLLHRSDGYRQIAVRAVPLRGRLGDSVQWVGSARDVHEKRVALDQLRRTEQELRLILDTTPARIAYIENNGRFRWANRTFLERFVPDADIRGASVASVFPLADHVTLDDAISRGLRGIPGQVEWMQDDEQHGTRWSLTSCTPDVGVDGTVAGCITLCTDHTERKRTEQALRRSNGEHRALAESVPHMVWIAYGDGRMFYFNQRWRDYTGVSSVDTWHAAILPEDRVDVLMAFRTAVATGKELSTELRLVRAGDGAARWHVMRAVPVADEGQRIARWYGTCTDIEDQKQAQNTLQRAQQRTQQFLATLSHELRNPLSALMTSAHLLNRPDLADENRPLLAQTIRRQTVQLQRLVEDLLDISRITQGKVQLQIEQVDFTQVIRDVSDDFSERAGNLGVMLSCKVPDAPAWVRGDPARLRQIVDNLTSNALKATPAGGQVTIVLDTEGHRQVLRVVDTGPGIEDALFPRMFEPFVQGQSWRERGLGLGLSIVMRMTELHGGEVRACNLDDGRGACFEVRLPGIDCAVAPAPLQVEQAQHPCEAIIADILIIDDEVDHADALRLLLELHGYRISVAYEGEQALRMLAQSRPDAVICDIGLPGEWNGYQLAERMRIDHGNDLLLIAFSGFGTRADVKRSLQAGFDSHLLKPSPPSQVMGAINEGLQRKRRLPPAAPGMEPAASMAGASEAAVTEPPMERAAG
jgi:PAS domain S-box-containing protein